MSLPSVKIDIVGQGYKKGTEVKYQKRRSHFTPIQSICLKSIQLLLSKRFLSSSLLSVWSINFTSQNELCLHKMTVK